MGTITVSLNKDLDIAIFTVRGQTGFENIRKAIDDYYVGNLTKYTIWDFTDPDTPVTMTGEDIRRLAKMVAEKGVARRGGYDALIVEDMIKYGLARIFAAATEIIASGDKPLKTVVFKKMDEAMTWIRHDSKFSKDDWMPPLNVPM